MSIRGIEYVKKKLEPFDYEYEPKSNTCFSFERNFGSHVEKLEFVKKATDGNWTIFVQTYDPDHYEYDPLIVDEDWISRAHACLIALNQD